MGKTVNCKDLGDLECTWQGRADTEEELIEMAKVHGRDAHGITEVSDELMSHLKAAIKDE
jgi:predicted small metal-binding protein